jgi:menaquinone-9 beta-reductase
LQQAGRQVALVERRVHPTNKLCGEFLSADGVASLRRLGLHTASFTNVPSIGEVLISSVSGRCWQNPLPMPGLGWSRQKMDHTLIERCRRIGVDVIQGLRIESVHGNDDHGYDIRGSSTMRPRTLKTRFVIGAFGRRAVLHRKLGRQKSAPASRPMAFKLHIPGGCTPGRVELHMFPGGYVGLCEIENRQSNLCLLTDTDVFRRAGSNYERFCKEHLMLNPVLRQRLDALRPSWQDVVAVANLTFGPQPRTMSGVLMVGDAAASISPLCGDGMSMALRTGELVAPLVHRFLNEELSGQALRQAYDQRWQQEFSRRLRLGSVIQHLFFKPFLSQAAMTLLQSCPSIGQQLIKWTRGQTHTNLDNTYVS